MNLWTTREYGARVVCEHCRERPAMIDNLCPECWMAANTPPEPKRYGEDKDPLG